MHNPPTFIDLFAGCGGLSLGLLQAGWKALFAVEKSQDAFSTLRHNLVDGKRFHYQWPEWLPKTNHDIEEFLDNYHEQISNLNGQVDLIAGGPPCQGFSPAGKRDPNDPRNRLAEKYIEVVALVRPKFIIIENVKGINSSFIKAMGEDTAIAPYSHVIRSNLEELGYKVSFQVIKSVDFGVPQLRPRFIFIASREDLKYDNNHFDELLESRKDFLKRKGLPDKRPITVREAIADLEVTGKKLIPATDSPIKGYSQVNYPSASKASSSFIRLMRKGCGEGHMPNGLRLPKHSPEVQSRFEKILAECRKGYTLSIEDRKRYGTKKHAITPLDSGRPSATLTTLPDDVLHYSEARILTVREMARIQSFPDWFSFLGPYTTGGKHRKQRCPKYTQVGNAVPPLLSEAIAVHIKKITRRYEICRATKTS